MQRTAIAVGLAAALTALSSYADHIEELVVTASHDTRTVDITDELVISPDVAQLLKKAPGANVNSNGPITGIPQYRGMYGPRIAVSFNGSQLAPSGPNWMDPPLSYATSGQLQSLTVYRGIAPVSVAQESIGGVVSARSNEGEFSNSRDFSLAGRVIGSAQSVNSGYNLNTQLFASNFQHRFKLAAMAEAGGDAEFPGGDILPTEYERQRFDVGYGLRLGDHSIQIEYGYNDTGESGTPALPMDIDYFEGDLYKLSYRFNRDGQIESEASVYGSQLEHGMTNFHLRQPPSSGAHWRQNIADSDNLGFKLKTTMHDDAGAWTFGFDGFESEHNSDIDNPNNPMFFVVNFNDAERRALGLFLERQQDFSGNWRGEFGFRYNEVTMDADKVNGTPAMMMPPAQMLRDAFNNADRKQTDHNVDLVAKAWYRASEHTSWYAGISQKHRSPAYQERYLWLPMQATAGMADGMTYTGNIELEPEVARQLEFGFDYSNNNFTIAPRLFYSRVDDYIQGTPSEVTPALMMVRMMNTMNGSNNPDPLHFNNVDAVLYGLDLDWAWQLADHWALSGLVNYVRGKRDDIEDELYRIAPANATVRLDYSQARWSVGVETVMYSTQNQVSETNREQETSGHAVLNLSGLWQVSDQLQLAAGVDNLLDKEHEDHLAGYNRAANPDIGKGARLPGYGTNIFARASYSF